MAALAHILSFLFCNTSSFQKGIIWGTGSAEVYKCTNLTAVYDCLFCLIGGFILERFVNVMRTQSPTGRMQPGNPHKSLVWSQSSVKGDFSTDSVLVSR